MTTLTFDSLGYVRKLEEAGFTRQQAEVQAEALRQQAEMQAEALRQQTEALRRQLEERYAALRRELQQTLQRELDRYDEAPRRTRATRGDVQDVRFEIAKVRGELNLDIAKVTYQDLFRWVIGVWVILVVLLAKGFGWLRF